MKHINVALFAVHEGCPHMCSFCNQRSISGKSKKLSPDDVHSAANVALSGSKDVSGGVIPDHALLHVEGAGRGQHAESVLQPAADVVGSVDQQEIGRQIIAIGGVRAFCGHLVILMGAEHGLHAVVARQLFAVAVNVRVSRNAVGFQKEIFFVILHKIFL